MAVRRDVLSLYRQILRLSRTWEACNTADTQTERTYIREEAGQLFRQNKHLDDAEEIKQHLREGQARVDIAIHYKNPYPRPTNIPQNVLPPTGAKLKKGQRRAIKQSTPVYLKSLYDNK